LPEEILLEVLSYCSSAEDRLSIMQVCKKWNVVGKDMTLWKNRTLWIGNRVSMEDIRIVLSTFGPSLQSYEIHLNSKINRLLKELRQVKVKHLYITNLLENDNEASVEHMISSLGQLSQILPNLESLKMENIHLQVKFFEQTSQLRSLDLFTKWTSVDDNTMETIADHCPNLEFLRISQMVRVVWNNRTVRKIVDKLPSLKAFHTSGTTTMSDESLQYIFQNCQGLLEFQADVNEMSVETLTVISTMMNLQQLCLTAFALVRSCDSLTPMFRHGFPNMKILGLRDFSSSLADDTLTKIATACPNVEWLDVSDSYIRDAGVSNLLNTCRKLKALSVSLCIMLTGESWLSRWKGTAITYLDIKGCPNLNPDLVFLASLPSLSSERITQEILWTKAVQHILKKRCKELYSEFYDFYQVFETPLTQIFNLRTLNDVYENADPMKNVVELVRHLTEPDSDIHEETVLKFDPRKFLH